MRTKGFRHDLMVVWSLQRQRTPVLGCKVERPIVTRGSNGRPRRLVAVSHQVTTRDVADPKQIFTKRAGRFLFRGLWYGDRNPRNHRNFGKVEGQVGLPIGKVTGRRLSPFLLKRMSN